MRPSLIAAKAFCSRVNLTFLLELRAEVFIFALVELGRVTLRGDVFTDDFLLDFLELVFLTEDVFLVREPVLRLGVLDLLNEDLVDVFRFVEPGREDERDAGREVGREEDRERGLELGRELLRDAGRELAREPDLEPTRDPVRDATRDPPREPTREPAVDPALDPDLDPARDPALDARLEPGRLLGRDWDRDMARVRGVDGWEDFLRDEARGD